uniref:Elongation of very long chain fatty acids protein n=1 Tax=Seriola dumerili TaxID=41447 RepID=A0A3B4TV71_SERDU
SEIQELAHSHGIYDYLLAGIESCSHDCNYCCATYSFVLYLGPRIMANLLMSGWATTYTWRCDAVDTSNSPQALPMVRVVKTLGMALTNQISSFGQLFFVLRKKHRPDHLLHIFHHSFMPWTWVSLMFCDVTPGGMGSFHAMVNSSVHVIMYFYYGLAAAGPQFQKFLSLWLTTDFSPTDPVCASICPATQYYFMDSCDYQFPMILHLIWMYGTFFLLLFSNFWIQAYVKGKRLATNRTLSRVRMAQLYTPKINAREWAKHTTENGTSMYHHGAPTAPAMALSHHENIISYRGRGKAS